jgi:hypothetical protein
MIKFKAIMDKRENRMKKISLLSLFFAMFAACGGAIAGYDDQQFRAEVQKGLDILAARANVDVVEDDAPGELGSDVYQTKNAVNNDDMAIHILNDMYLRAGAGFNMPFASDRAGISGDMVKTSGAFDVQIGLGFNMSSYVRTEIDFQTAELRFSEHEYHKASMHQIGGTLYFDFARRYVMSGDITKRRTLVPYMGLGAGIGAYEFQGDGGAGGFFVAPRGVLGFNVMLTDLVGIDVAYQYQMFIGNGFGWNVHRGGVQNLGDVMVSFRFNF